MLLLGTFKMSGSFGAEILQICSNLTKKRIRDLTDLNRFVGFLPIGTPLYDSLKSDVKLASRRDGMKSRRDGMASRRGVMPSRRAVSNIGRQKYDEMVDF